MKRFGLLVLVFAGFFEVFSQDTSEYFTIGCQDSLYSEILNEKRPLHISLPLDYEESGRSYPVLFLLDGEALNIKPENFDLLHNRGGGAHRLRADESKWKPLGIGDKSESSE